MHKLHDAHDSLRHCIWTTRGCCEDVADPVTRDTVARDTVAGQAAPSDTVAPLDAVERPAGDTVAPLASVRMQFGSANSGGS